MCFHTPRLHGSLWSDPCVCVCHSALSPQRAPQPTRLEDRPLLGKAFQAIDALNKEDPSQVCERVSVCACRSARLHRVMAPPAATSTLLAISFSAPAPVPLPALACAHPTREPVNSPFAQPSDERSSRRWYWHATRPTASSGHSLLPTQPATGLTSLLTCMLTGLLTGLAAWLHAGGV